MKNENRKFEKFELDLIGIAAAIGMMLIYAFARDAYMVNRTTFGSTNDKVMHLLISHLDQIGGAKFVYLLLVFFIIFFTYHAIKDYRKAKGIK